MTDPTPKQRAFLLMNDTKEEDMKEKSTDVTVVKPSVTQHQEKRGLEFVNKQLQRISGE